MKKKGILNSQISQVLAGLRHTDTIVIGDCGLPVPVGVKEIDLALTLGKPSFLDVLEVVLTDFEVEKATIAEEISKKNPLIEKEILKKINLIEYTSHEEFKELMREAKVVIRTGENTPYANIFLHSGVIF